MAKSRKSSKNQRVKISHHKARKESLVKSFTKGLKTLYKKTIGKLVNYSNKKSRSRKHTKKPKSC